MISIYGVSIVLYFLKLLSGNLNFWKNLCNCSLKIWLCIALNRVLFLFHTSVFRCHATNSPLILIGFFVIVVWILQNIITLLPDWCGFSCCRKSLFRCANLCIRTLEIKHIFKVLAHFVYINISTFYPIYIL